MAAKEARKRRRLWTVSVLLLAAGVARAQEEIPPFHEYDPPSTLVVPENRVTRARYPFVDVHNHQFRMGDGQDLGELVGDMDRLNMAVMVNLSGRGFRRLERPDGSTRFRIYGGDFLKRAIANARENAPGRFVVFTNLDVYGMEEPGWTERTLRQLEADVAAAALQGTHPGSLLDLGALVEQLEGAFGARQMSLHAGVLAADRPQRRVERHQQHCHREGDAEGQHQIQQDGRNRDDHQAQDDHDGSGTQHVAVGQHQIPVYDRVLLQVLVSCRAQARLRRYT